MKSSWLVLIACLMSSLGFGAEQKVSINDVKVLSGAPWHGTLTYLDYSRNTPVSIPSDLVVSQSTDEPSAFVFDYRYPDEPKANSKATVTISQDGTMLDEAAVISKQILADKTVVLVTEQAGEDDNRKAVIRKTLSIHPQAFSVVKEVRREGEKDYFERHRYSWKR